MSEIDALGGEMGKAADACLIQSRTLNKGKGAAVHALRAQCDRTKYHLYMKQILEKQKNLVLKQDEVIEIIFEQKKVKGIRTRLGLFYEAKAVIIASGTYLDAKIHMGDCSFSSGADGVLPATVLGKSLEKAGIKLRRFKTGTPARINRRSIDFSKTEAQYGDEIITPFTFDSTQNLQNQVLCYITYTNQNTHKIITDNLHSSPLYSGRIHGRGPRYCPSIEDKVVRFADKDRHQIFIEPMGLDTDEFYLQGLSSSLPAEVQEQFIRTIAGLENAEIMRHAYAIEYDCCDPLCLYATLEFKEIQGLFSAGQFNSTSGYEEAAGQGLIAGVNAARKVQGKEPVILERSSSYIGTLIDDLVTKGCDEPYRMMTARSEFRLMQRQDNAPERLCKLGYKWGLLEKARYEYFLEARKLQENEIERLRKTVVKPSPELNQILEERQTTPITGAVKLIDLLKRPQIFYKDLVRAGLAVRAGLEGENLPPYLQSKVETEVKYEGYIKIQEDKIKKARSLEKKKLPLDFDYKNLKGLSIEAAEKLNLHTPLTVGQAGRISGVNPADVAVLLVWLATL